MKKYTVVGNNKKVTLPVNSTKLKVVGSNCIVRVVKNDGEIEIVGNDCRLELEENHGCVNVVGCNCTININKRLKGDKVQIIGQFTQLIVDGKKERNSMDTQLSPFSKDLDDVLDSIFNFNFVPR